jgi:hypothetical protein
MMNRLRLLLRSLAWWILGNVRPAEDEIDAALRAACTDAGVDPALYAPDYQPGVKAAELLFHASRRLGNPIVTMQDLKELLR